jgi:hypothetical protein
MSQDSVRNPRWCSRKSGNGDPQPAPPYIPRRLALVRPRSAWKEFTRGVDQILGGEHNPSQFTTVSPSCEMIVLSIVVP